jgi:hypothetical protein
VQYKLRFSPAAAATLKELENGGPNERAKLKKIKHTLGLIETNPRHPGLQSYPFENFPGAPRGVKVWHSYVENKTPSAWRIWWRYGPNEGDLRIITVLFIGPHT